MFLIISDETVIVHSSAVYDNDGADIVTRISITRAPESTFGNCVVGLIYSLETVSFSCETDFVIVNGLRKRTIREEVAVVAEPSLV